MKMRNETASVLSKIALLLPIVPFVLLPFFRYEKIYCELFYLCAVPTSMVLCFLIKFKSPPYTSARRIACITMAINMPFVFSVTFVILQTIYEAYGYRMIVIGPTIVIESMALSIYIIVAYVRGRFL